MISKPKLWFVVFIFTFFQDFEYDFKEFYLLIHS
jgi:hypothetical protein